jgi:hypothetical protein
MPLAAVSAESEPAEDEAGAGEFSNDEIRESTLGFASAALAIAFFAKLTVESRVDESETGAACDGIVLAAMSVGTPWLEVSDESSKAGNAWLELSVDAFTFEVSEFTGESGSVFGLGNLIALTSGCGEPDCKGGVVGCVSDPSGLIASEPNDEVRFGRAVTVPTPGIESVCIGVAFELPN